MRKCSHRRGWSGLTVKDFHLLVSLNVFNTLLMNQAVLRFAAIKTPHFVTLASKAMTAPPAGWWWLGQAREVRTPGPVRLCFVGLVLSPHAEGGQRAGRRSCPVTSTNRAKAAWTVPGACPVAAFRVLVPPPSLGWAACNRQASGLLVSKEHNRSLLL